jgi:hypothetical protein
VSRAQVPGGLFSLAGPQRQLVVGDARQHEQQLEKVCACVCVCVCVCVCGWGRRLAGCRLVYTCCVHT